MPELPEVETVRIALEQKLTNHILQRIVVRERRLRYPVPDSVRDFSGGCLTRISRRSRYLLLEFRKEDSGSELLIHLGMSGRLRYLDTDIPVQKHDHVDLIFLNPDSRTQTILRYHDPRRFGFILPVAGAGEKFLRDIRPEPDSPEFTTEYLASRLQTSKSPVKARIMDGRVVAGVGNIYANEALFLSGIHPLCRSDLLNGGQSAGLHHAMQETIRRAIQAGGTTLRDFYGADGHSGYFQNELSVYGRSGQSCLVCGTTILRLVHSNRSSFFCPQCQPEVSTGNQ